MRRQYLSIFMFLLVVCLSNPSIYCENEANQVHPQTSTEVHRPNEHSTATQKTPKNYFDIKANEKEDDHFLSEFTSMLTTLGIIVTIILIATWFLKKMVNTHIQQLNTSSLIKIIERRTLTPKSAIYLVDIQGEGFILAESTNGVTSLGSFNVKDQEKSTENRDKETKNS